MRRLSAGNGSQSGSGANDDISKVADDVIVACDVAHAYRRNLGPPVPDYKGDRNHVICTPNFGDNSHVEGAARSSTTSSGIPRSH